MKKWKFLGYVYLFILLTGCKERFEPNLPALKQNYLVVEGIINANGLTKIKLSRSVPLDQKNKFIPELNATMRIEGEANAVVFFVPHTGGGLYSSATLLNPVDKYRLRINTADGKEYLSKFVPVKLTPDIDSISWKEENGGVQLYANTHDPKNSTLYYRWDFDETWEIRSAYSANYKFDNNTIRATLPTDPQIYYCWKYASSNSIILGSSAKLESDKIFLQPLHFLARNEERLGIRYSILVRQYALDKEGYGFFEQMKKNTESLGTIFDPQPSALRGNITCITNPEDIVIGYVNAAAIKEQRIFINSFQLSGRGFSINGGTICNSFAVLNDPDSIKRYIPPGWPYDAIQRGANITFYLTAPSLCVDCRERGGINVKPSYW